MQPISPRQYFETRLRKLPIYKCMVNADWEREKMAQVMVLRKHVNGNISGANFLVDLLCLGVKDTTWFFNTDADEMEEMLNESGLDWEEVSYELAHNIVYAGLEFAAEFHIKPHPDFSIAKYALEEDDDAIELIEIETGEDGIPHLIERHPGQYADAHGKLKKYAGEGNYRISLAIIEDSNEDQDDDFEYDKELDEKDWDDEEDWEEDYISLKDIAIDDLTLYDTLMLRDEDFVNTQLIATRSETEQMKISIGRFLHLYETLSQNPGFNTQTDGMHESVDDEIQLIHEVNDENFFGNLPYPNGCDEKSFEEGIEQFLDFIQKLAKGTALSKKAELTRMLQTIGGSNPLVIAHGIFHLLIDSEGPSLFKSLQPFIHTMRQYPIVALAQTFLVTAYPERFPEPPLLTSNSHSLQDVCPDYPEFSDEEYTLFYALRSLQAAMQKNVPLMVTWTRLLAAMDEADIFMGMVETLYRYILDGAEGFLEKVREKREKTLLPRGESQQ